MILFILFILFNYSNAHSWIDKLECYNENGQLLNVGYPRSYSLENIDRSQTKLLIGRNLDASIEIPKIYTSQFPMLNCNAGNIIKFYYNSNGHTTLDPYLSYDERERTIINGISLSRKTYWSIHVNLKNELKTRKDINIGTNFNDENGLRNYIYKHKEYFDGICDDRDNPRIPCIGEFKIPYNMPKGEFNFIWYWIFDFDPRATGEEYFTSFDINISSDWCKV